MTVADNKYFTLKKSKKKKKLAYLKKLVCSIEIIDYNLENRDSA